METFKKHTKKPIILHIVIHIMCIITWYVTQMYCLRSVSLDPPPPRPHHKETTLTTHRSPPPPPQGNDPEKSQTGNSTFSTLLNRHSCTRNSSRKILYICQLVRELKWWALVSVDTNKTKKIYSRAINLIPELTVQRMT